jgi:hypothetical protein
MPYSDQLIGAKQRFNRLYLEPKMKIGSARQLTTVYDDAQPQTSGRKTQRPKHRRNRVPE